MEEQLRRLDELEAEGCPSLDRAADTFAELLRAAAPSSGEESRDRAMEQLLYHLGRWIYLLDAQDDLEEDRTAGRYNPVAARFRIGGDRDAMARTLDHSRNLMYSAAQLADFRCRWPLIENILYLGLPLVQRAVFDGSWKQIQNKRYGEVAHERSVQRVGRQPECQRSGDQKAYRELARKYHPDNYVNNPLADLAEEKMKEVNEAYEAIQKQRSGAAAISSSPPATTRAAINSSNSSGSTAGEPYLRPGAEPSSTWGT